MWKRPQAAFIVAALAALVLAAALDAWGIHTILEQRETIRQLSTVPAYVAMDCSEEALCILLDVVPEGVPVKIDATLTKHGEELVFEEFRIEHLVETETWERLKEPEEPEEPQERED